MGKHREAFGLAWHLTRDELVGSNLKLAVSSMLAVSASVLSYTINFQLGRDNPGDQFIPLLVGPAAFLGVFAIVLLFNWCFRAPYERWRQAESRTSELEQRLRPRFSVPVLQGAKPEAILYGNTVTTISGKKTTIINRTNDLLAVPIINEAATTLRSCEAYLSRFEEVGGGEPKYWQSMRLAWLPVDQEHSAVDIPSQGQRTLMLFRVIGNRVQLVTNDVPVKMVNFIQDKGEYEGLVVLTAQDAPATYIAYGLTCDAPENPPTLTILRRSLGDFDDDSAWAKEQPFLA